MVDGFLAWGNSFFLFPQHRLRKRVKSRRTQAIEDTGEEVSASTKSLYAATTEHLQSLKAAKTYGAEALNFSIFSDLSAGVAQANTNGMR
jgi:hypothetical protein